MSETDYPTIESGHVPEAEVIWKLPAPKTSAFPDRCPCGGEIDPDIIELRGIFPSLAQLCTACYSLAQREEEASAVRDRENAEHRHRLAALVARREADEACDALNAYRELDGHDEAEAHRMHVHFFELADKAVQMSEAAIKKARTEK